MTAAVARPPLFRHLLASNPEHQKGSFAATASAVLLHAGVVVAAVALTARVQRAPVDEVIIDHYVPPQFPTLTPDVKTGGGSNVGGPVGPAPTFDFEFKPPTDVPREIPPDGSMNGLLNALDKLMVARPSPGPGTGNGDGAAGDQGPFVPITIAPQLLNRADVGRTMQRLYPPLLLQSGIGGTVLVWLHLDENGTVIDARLKKTSGQTLLDEAALKVAQTARFSPAYNRDQRVRVWVELPIVFGTR